MRICMWQKILNSRFLVWQSCQGNIRVWPQGIANGEALTRTAQWDALAAASWPPRSSSALPHAIRVVTGGAGTGSGFGGSSAACSGQAKPPWSAVDLPSEPKVTCHCWKLCLLSPNSDQRDGVDIRISSKDLSEEKIAAVSCHLACCAAAGPHRAPHPAAEDIPCGWTWRQGIPLCTCQCDHNVTSSGPGQ